MKITTPSPVQISCCRAPCVGRVADQVDAVDHRQPEPVQQHHAGQDHRVGVGQAPAHGEVGEQHGDRAQPPRRGTKRATSRR